MPGSLLVLLRYRCGIEWWSSFSSGCCAKFFYLAFGRKLAFGRNLAFGRKLAFGRIMAFGHNMAWAKPDWHGPKQKKFQSICLRTLHYFLF
jgi:hypothetical protein